MAKGMIIGIVALLAVALTGCGATETTDTGETQAQGFANVQPDETATKAPETVTDDAALEGVDAEFIAYVRDELDKLPTRGLSDTDDADLIAAAQDACEQLIAGTASEDIRLFEGEVVATSGYFMDSGTVVDGARRLYCPETIG